MSLDLVKEIFSALPDCKEWHAHLLSFTHSKRHGTTYNCRRIELEPSERLSVLIQDISSGYTGEDLDALLQGIADSDSEADPFSMKAQAYVLCGNMRCDDEGHQIKLISMNTPITTLKNRFWHDKGKFWEIPDKVLNLRTSMNVIIYDRTVYFLDMSGETLFNMERAYKLKCSEAIDEIEGLKIISDPEMFRSTASSGQNPRRFAAFSKSKQDYNGGVFAFIYSSVICVRFYAMG